MVQNISSVKILHLSASRFRGAGIATVNLCKYLEQAGFESFLYVPESQVKGLLGEKMAQMRKRLIPDKTWSKIKKLVGKDKKEDAAYNMHSLGDTLLNTNIENILNKVPFVPNIIVLHWVGGFLNAEKIQQLSVLTKAKIYWLMLDDAPITGGCHFPWDCLGYTAQCGSCPGIYSNDRYDITYKQLQQKKELFEKIDISAIATSEGDYLRAKSSSLFKEKSVFKMLLPVDSNRFVPNGNNQQLRKQLGIPMNKKVVLFGASNIQDKRKGGALFLRAWELLSKENVCLLLVGKVDKEYLNQFSGEVIYLGTVDEKKLIQCYQCSDFFVCPTVEDSGPYMINQSLMCGTPVVSFNVGGSIDLVVTGRTGYNCGIPSVESLLKGMKYIVGLNDSENFMLRRTCRKFALEKLSVERFVDKFNHIIS